MNKENVTSVLMDGITDIVFEKADGTLRAMKATLAEQFLPEPVASDEEVNRNRKPNENVRVVWDTEASGWRSFRWDKLKSVNGVDFVNREE